MTPRTFDELFDPPLRLTLEQERGNYIVVHDDTPGSLASGSATVYMRSPDLDLCVRFMRAMHAKHEATLDEDSIEWFRMLRVQEQHSVRVPALEGTAQAAAAVPSNVVPIRKAAG